MKNTNRLQNLIDLAKEPSGERRRDLLREVTDLFLEKPADLSEAETQHFSEIMSKVAFDLEMAVRRELAERLSHTDSAPHDLITKLANDEIEVAQPVLANSTVLKNADLIEIIKRHSQDHMKVIAVREDVAKEVSHTLVEHGSDDILETLVQNKGAQMSRKTMETVIARAENSERLHKPLINRQDLPPDLMNEMFWFVSKALREEIVMKNDAIDDALLNEALASTKAAMGNEAEEAEANWSAPEKFIRRKERLKQLDQGLLVQLLRQGKLNEFLFGFARLADLDVRTAKHIIFKKDSQALAIGCKAIGFDRATFSNLLLLSDEKGERSTEEVFELLSMYDKITTEACQRTMRFWRTRKRTMQHNAAEKAYATAGG